MDQISTLRQQAEKAERLAKSGFDVLTCQRLLQLCDEYRKRASDIEIAQPPRPVFS
jgi:hypothetical protein